MRKTKPVRTDLAACGKKASEAARSALREIESMLIQVTWGAADLIEAPDLPHYPQSRSPESVALEMAARSIMPGRIPDILKLLRRSLKYVKLMAKNVVPIPVKAKKLKSKPKCKEPK